jgi:hypothetical protein
MCDEAYKINVAKMSATDRAVMMYNTATRKSGYSLKDTVGSAQQLEVQDEEPPKEHDDQDEGTLFKDVTKVPAPIQKDVEDHRTK